MAKITLNNISGGYASIATINGNSDTIEAAFENTLSRDGTSPNTMLANLDMNSNRIINLASPSNANDAARYVDIQSVVTIAIAPSQSGNKGKFLITDGSTASWSHAFCDTTDFTKKVDFSLSGITTGTTRTKTFQDQNGTIYETGGTDVAVTDGGTGLSTFGAKGAIPVATAATTLAAQAVGTDGHSIIASSGQTNGIQYISPNLGFSLLNGYLDWSVSGNALTVAIKGEDGNNPSATNPVFAKIRSSTVATGLPSLVKIVAANSVVVSSGSTLGTRSSNIPFKIWIVLFDDAGTYRLGVINCVTSVAGSGTGSDITSIYPLSGFSVASSTAEGGAGAADSAQTFYTGTAVASKAYTPIGFASWETGLATAGTWASGPTRVHLYSMNTPLPGTVVQTQRTDTGAMTTGSTVIPVDDTIPQSGEGDQYVSQAITPTSAANILRIRTSIYLANDIAAAFVMSSALFRDATANALKAVGTHAASQNHRITNNLTANILAESTTATTFKVRSGGSGAATTTFNGQTGVRTFGGILNSYIEVEELMG